MKNWPRYMTKSTAARYCELSDAEFAQAERDGKVNPIPTDGPGMGRLYARSDLDAGLAKSVLNR